MRDRFKEYTLKPFALAYIGDNFGFKEMSRVSTHLDSNCDSVIAFILRECGEEGLKEIINKASDTFNTDLKEILARSSAFDESAINTIRSSHKVDLSKIDYVTNVKPYFLKELRKSSNSNFGNTEADQIFGTTHSALNFFLKGNFDLLADSLNNKGVFYDTESSVSAITFQKREIEEHGSIDFKNLVEKIYYASDILFKHNNELYFDLFSFFLKEEAELIYKKFSNTPLANILTFDSEQYLSQKGLAYTKFKLRSDVILSIRDIVAGVDHERFSTIICRLMENDQNLGDKDNKSLWKWSYDPVLEVHIPREDYSFVFSQVQIIIDGVKAALSLVSYIKNRQMSIFSIPIDVFRDLSQNTFEDLDDYLSVYKHYKHLMEGKEIIEGLPELSTKTAQLDIPLSRMSTFTGSSPSKSLYSIRQKMRTTMDYFLDLSIFNSHKEMGILVLMSMIFHKERDRYKATYGDNLDWVVIVKELLNEAITRKKEFNDREAAIKCINIIKTFDNSEKEALFLIFYEYFMDIYSNINLMKSIFPRSEGEIGLSFIKRPRICKGPGLELIIKSTNNKLFVDAFLYQHREFINFLKTNSIEEISRYLGVKCAITDRSLLYKASLYIKEKRHLFKIFIEEINQLESLGSEYPVVSGNKVINSQISLVHSGHIDDLIEKGLKTGGYFLGLNGTVMKEEFVPHYTYNNGVRVTHHYIQAKGGSR